MGRRTLAAAMGLSLCAGVTVKPKMRNGISGWDGMARDMSGRWETKVGFPTPQEAVTWATKRRAEFEGGAAAGAAYLDAIFASYAKATTSADQRRRVGRLVEVLIANGMRDMKGKTFALRFEDWLKGIDNQWCYETDDPHRPPAAPLDPSTRLKFVTHVRTLANHAMRRMPHLGIRSDPLATIDLGEKGERPNPIKPTFLVSEMKALVSDERRDDAWWLPNCLLVYTGFRCSLAFSLQWHQFDFANDVVTWVNEKNGVPTTSPLQPELKEALMRVMTERGLTPETAKGYVIESESMRTRGSDGKRARRRKGEGERTSEDAHSHAFDRMLKRFGIPLVTPDGRKRSTHSTRHSFIALHLAAGTPIDHIQNAVGHETREMTTKTYGRERAFYVTAVKPWPKERMCLRHAPDSAFHAPPVKAAVASPDILTLALKLAELSAANATMAAKLAAMEADKEMIVVLDGEPLPGPGSRLG